jgi:hypothetical protein
MANIGADKDIIDYLNTTYVLKCLNHYRWFKLLVHWNV